jgi:5'-nucleotidase
MTLEKPLILVVNDDGIFAPGIKALIQVASTLGEVVVVAPDSPQSAKGHAITINDPIRIKKVDIFPNIVAYECSGTPVDCVKIAKHVVLKGRKIDFCVSGINHGSNASINIIYSGTMSAAMEASVENIPAIGFSLCDFAFDADFEPYKEYVYKIIDFIIKNPMRSGKLLNVNIPKCKTEEIMGIKVCRQAEGRWVEEFKEGFDPSGRPYYWLTGKFLNDDDGTDTDLAALDLNYISIVPSGHDLTNYQAIAEVKKMEGI